VIARTTFTREGDGSNPWNFPVSRPRAPGAVRFWSGVDEGEPPDCLGDPARIGHQDREVEIVAVAVAACELGDQREAGGWLSPKGTTTEP